MDLDVNAKYLQLGNVNLHLKELVAVKKMRVPFGGKSIYFIYVNSGKSLFFYANSTQYSALLSFIVNEKDAVRGILRKYANIPGAEHDLWQQLLSAATDNFNVSFFRYLCSCGLDLNFAYTHSAVVPQKVDSIDSIYNFLVSVLPENIKETRRKKALHDEEVRKEKLRQQEKVRKQREDQAREAFEAELKQMEEVARAKRQKEEQKIEAEKAQKKKAAESVLQKVLSACGEDFSQGNAYIKNLETQNGNNLSKWKKSVSVMDSDKADLRYFQDYNDCSYESSTLYTVEGVLDAGLKYSMGRVSKLVEEALCRQYGPVSYFKKNLRSSIDRLGFSELQELSKEYDTQTHVWFDRLNQTDSSEEAAPYKAYIDVYRLGSVLISDRINQLNRNKTKNKYISQDLLNEAMVFYYDADSPQDAYATRSAEIYSQAKESGDKGEKKVDYALKWLDTSYTVIEKRSKDKAGSPCILLFNPGFIDEKQEYDHLIVSGKGVFNIETKNFAGKLVVDNAGNWIRKKDGDEEGVKNPLQQVRQHEKLLASFLPKECRIISILCIANDKAIIEGSEHCPIPIVKSDLLVELIENWQATDSELSDEQKKDCITAIYEHMV
mgnify:FL=1